jgi:hypothetical protein
MNMTVHVEQAITEVISEAEPSAAEGNAESTEWEKIEQLRGAYSRMLRDDARTTAEGFDD